MISENALKVFLADCNESGDTKTAMLIECLLESYHQLDSERAQKATVVRSSSDILVESRKKDARIAELLISIDAQNTSLQATIAAFRKIYEMSVFGNEFFKVNPLLQLWVSVEKFLGSKTDNEFRDNNIELLASLATMNDDKYLIDMRNNMVNFRKYMETNNEQAEREQAEREQDTTGDNA